MPLKRDASLPSDWDRMLEGLEPRSYRSIKELEAALDEHLGSESPPGVRFSGQNALKVLEAESWLRRDGQEVHLWLPSDQAKVKVAPGRAVRRGPLSE